MSKKDKIIENEDIYDYITQSTDAREIVNKYKKYIENRKTKPTLMQIYWHISGANFIWIVILTFVTQGIYHYI